MKKINGNIKKLYIVIICFLFIKIISAIGIIPMLKNIIPILWIIIFIVGILITHSDYNRFVNIKNKIYTVMIILTIYMMISFSLGLVFGFSYNVYQNNSLKLVLFNLYLYVIPVISSEYIRGILCNYSSNSYKLRIVISFLFILINLNFIGFNSIFMSGETFLKFLCLNLIPTIASELALTYICYTSSYKISLTYSLMFTLYYVFMLIVPKLNFFLIGILNTILPVITYLVIDRYHELEISKAYNTYKRNIVLNYIPIFLIVSVIALNIFNVGIFRYGALSILSDSMQPLYSKGDAIIYEKLNDKAKKKLKEGDIIVFTDKKDNMIIHRIVKISENKIVTKGDNNKNNDSQILEFNDVKGKYLFYIKYLGYPKLLMYEMLN